MHLCNQMVVSYRIWASCHQKRAQHEDFLFLFLFSFSAFVFCFVGCGVWGSKLIASFTKIYIISSSQLLQHSENKTSSSSTTTARRTELEDLNQNLSGLGGRADGKHEQENDRQVRENHRIGPSFTEFSKVITDWSPTRVAVPILPHVPYSSRSRASSKQQAQHHLSTIKKKRDHS